MILFASDTVKVSHDRSWPLIASHADVLRSSSRVPAPRTSADLSGKTRTHSRLPDLESALWNLGIYSSRKDQEGLMEGENLTVLEQTIQLTHKCSY